MKRQHQYPAVIHRDEGSDYGVSFPDFPGCIGAGTSIEQALGDAEAALALHVAGMAEDGEAFPEPTPAEAALKDADPEGFVALAMVGATLPARSRRYNVTLPEDLVAEIDAVSANRSAFLAEAARARLARETRKRA